MRHEEDPMKRPTALVCILIAAILLPCALSAQSSAADASSSASKYYYANVSLDQAGLLEAIDKRLGGCTVATVNADGSPDIAVFVPGSGDADHIIFGFAPNVTLANIMRTKKAVICYFIYNQAETDKNKKYSGARIVVELEEDPAVLKAIRSAKKLGDSTTIMKIVKILPVG